MFKMWERSDQGYQCLWIAANEMDAQGPQGTREVAKDVRDGDPVEAAFTTANTTYVKISHIGKKKPVLEEGGGLVVRLAILSVEAAGGDYELFGIEMWSVGCWGEGSMPSFET